MNKKIVDGVQKVLIIRKILLSLTVLIFLIVVFPKNNFSGKLIISPFLICALSFCLENIFLLFNKEKIATCFRYIFSISFFSYIIGFLAYATYYSIVNKIYSLLIVVAIFCLFTIRFIKQAFFRRK